MLGRLTKALSLALARISHKPKVRRVASAGIQSWMALIGIRGGGTSHDQGCDEGTKQGSAAASGVVHELEESEVERQLLL
jgi:hypothetical protein